MEGVRVGNKKPNLKVNTSIDHGKIGRAENPNPVKVVSRCDTSGEGVYGLPLFSAAAKAAKGD